jgi:hypothetical protein
MQWCLPFLRQHAGRFISLFAVIARRGDTNGKPKTASNAMAKNLRNVFFKTPYIFGQSYGARYRLLYYRLLNPCRSVVKAIANLAINFARIVEMKAAEGQTVIQQHTAICYVHRCD